jgi:hypothetical protein
MDSVTLLTTDNKEEAEAVRKRLAEEGLPAILHDEKWLQRLLLVAKPSATEKIEVDRADYEKALEILGRMREEGSGPTEQTCPQCASAEIDYPQFTRKFITPALADLLIAIGVFPREFYCKSCHFTWADAPQTDRERDILGWPVDSPLWHPEHQRKDAR